MWMESDNPIYGRTNNPYDLSRTCGGSSGGSGALISSACGAFGITSDIGGSTRIPAFYNCYFGFKPTGGLISNDHCYPRAVGKLKDYCQLGPSCRYSMDLYPIFKTILNDPTSIPNPNTTNISELKVIYLDDSFQTCLMSKRHPELKKAELKVLEIFKQAGCQVMVKKYPNLSKGFFIGQLV